MPRGMKLPDKRGRYARKIQTFVWERSKGEKTPKDFARSSPISSTPGIEATAKITSSKMKTENAWAMMLFESRVGFERGRKGEKVQVRALGGYRAVDGFHQKRRKGIRRDHRIKLIIREQPTKNELPCSRFACRSAWCPCLRLPPQ